MSATAEADIEEILRPISAEQPTGVDPRLDPSYTSDWRNLRGAREEARRTEREATNEGRSLFESAPIWRNACGLAKRILSASAKDVEAACFLLEGWVRLDGFEGLRRGLTMLGALVNLYGNELFPTPESGEEPAERMRPIERLCNPLAETLIFLSITGNGEHGPIATWQFQQAERSESDGRSAPISLSDIQRTARETPNDFFLPLLEKLDKSGQALNELDQSLNELCGVTEAPTTRPLQSAIEEIQRALRALYADRVASAQQETFGDGSNGEKGSGGQAVADVTTAKGGGAPVRSREDAFRQLKQVADFFERMDPQCLLAAHIRRIVRLGNMSVTEYFSEVVEDKNARDQLFKLVGLEPPK